MDRAEPETEFFVDRSLGKSIVIALRDAGFLAYSMADVYGEQEAQRLRDEVWLRDAGDKGWVVLTKDDAIRRRPAERDALVGAGVRVFCLTAGQLRGAEQIQRFITNRERIFRQARSEGPFIYGVYASEIRRLWPER
jgi:hypothetical protein